MAERKVRVRFAPSPTGALHIGGVRTALYNYLFARQHDGDLIFRIEDTDSHRFVPGAEEYILESFKWLGIHFDEGVSFGGEHGPYRQSERREIYKKYVEVLLENGKAYIAFDTPEELDAKRAEIANFQYDASTRGMMRNSLTMPKEEVDALIAEGKQYVVRFKIEPNEDVRVNDLIRGEVIINSSILDDKVLYKSADELPTYHLANIVDDHLMEVSHVIRGEEWLPSAPLHVLLYRAFGWEDTMPEFAHLPLLLKPEGNGKLSKRDGDRLGFPVFPLEWHDPKSGEVSSGYRESGYLPEAVINFLALLGWNPGNDQEVMSMDELIKLFDLHRCSKSGAKFDYKKGIWFNHQYIQQKPNEEIAELFVPVLKEHGVEAPFEKVVTVVGMMKDRVSFVKELWETCSFFFVAPTEYDEKTVKKRWKEDSAKCMTELAEVIAGIEDFSIEGQEKVVMDDKVLYKSADELPTYHLANIVDDHLMEVSHVIRGEEWLPSAPLHVLLYRAFGWEDTMPEFAHLPLLLKPEGNGKLSKRDGDRLGFPVFPLEWHDPKSGEVSSGYRESGYLPEAVINFLALLGWNPGNDQEVMSMDELIKLFDLHRCSKSGAKFDYKKGIWFNHQYIQQKPNEEIAELFVPVLKEHGVEAPFEKVVTVVGMMKDRVSFVKELWETCSFFFVAPTEYDEKTVKKRWKEDSAKCMTELAEVIAGIEDFSIEGQEKVVMDWIAEKGYHTGNIMNAFRLTLVGEGKGPHMFDISWVLGKEETVARMKRAVEVLK